MKLQKVMGIIIITVLLLFACTRGENSREESVSKGVFSWHSLVEEKDCGSLHQYGIDTVYQHIKSSCSYEEVENFLETMSLQGMEVFLLDGEANWAYERHYDSVKNSLERVRSINRELYRRRGNDKGELKIKGLVLDIEPYLLKEWEENADIILDGMCRNLEMLYADKEELQIYLCVPYFYDSKGYEEQLEQLIRYTDGLLVMNYYKGSEIVHMETEVRLAAQYKKKIITVYELQEPGKHGLTEKNTYYNDGLDAVRLNYQQLREAYPEYRIGVAYHECNYFRN